MNTLNVIIDHMKHFNKDALMQRSLGHKWICIQCVGLLLANAAWAQATATGMWRTIDDATGKPRGAKAVPGSPWFEEGEILDPDNGKTYKLKMRVSEDGKALLLRGYIGPFYRTQNWERVQ
jgi:uncharacterized protein (DUF2147 family)